MCHVKRKCSSVRGKKKGNGANTAETIARYIMHTHTHYCIYISLSLFFCPLLTAFVHARAGQLCTHTSRHTHTEETPCMCCGKRVPRRWLWLDNRSFSNRCWPRCRPYKVPQLCTHPTGYLSQGVGGGGHIWGATKRAAPSNVVRTNKRPWDKAIHVYFPLLKSYNFYTG